MNMRTMAWMPVLMMWVSATLTARAAEPQEPGTGTLYFKSSPESVAIEALRQSTRIHAQVTGNVARVHVTQEFSNTGEDWVEGLYVFPLANDAAVDELLMHLGDRTVRGDIQEKVKAQNTYNQARSEGKQASLVNQERPNMFTAAVANVAPHSSISIEITYLETLPFRDARYTLKLPLAITPRYAPGAPVDARSPTAGLDAALANAALGTTATPERVSAKAQSVDIQIDLAAGFPLASLQSLHHLVTSTADGSVTHMQLRGTQIPADRDFELTWTPAPAHTVQTAAFAEKMGTDTYALIMLSPPNQAEEATQPREVTFIIDTSGSMGGPSIQQARAALQMGVDRLKAGDRFNVIRFASDYSQLFASPRDFNDASRDIAMRFITRLEANGGTEMRAPLEAAMATPPTEAYLQQIVFITDGSVGNEAELIALIHQRIGAARLFTVGIGAAPNSYFLSEAAAAGRGSYTFIADREQVQSRMQELFHKLERPALVDLKVQWPGTAADFAAPLPGDVYAGDPVVLLARLPSAPTGSLTLSGHMLGREWKQPITLSTVGGQSGLSKLWARERIADLSRQIQLGGSKDELKAHILSLALEHHLVSEMTSLIAVDDKVLRAPDESGHVEQSPTSAPTGTYWATTGFAKTATPAGLLLWCGLSSLFMGAALYYTQYRKAVVR
jgi:Ca-activated chloride channel homolog